MEEAAVASQGQATGPTEPAEGSDGGREREGEVAFFFFPFSATGGWWAAWNTISTTIKATAEKVVEVYKEDLREFAGNISNDSQLALEEVKHSELVEKARAAAAGSTLMSQLVDAISTEDDSRAGTGGTPGSRLDGKLLELQKDIGTFCTSPTEDKAYEEFSKSFVATQREKDILGLLSSSAVLTANYHKFVPVVVSYEEFWKRYFFREMRLREREKERQDLILKASEVALNQQQVDMSWEDDDTEWRNHVVEEMNFSTSSPAGDASINYSAGTVMSMIDGAVASPVAAPAPSVKDDDLLLDGWEEGPVLSATATAVDKTRIEDAVTPDFASPAKKVDVTIIEDYGGWE
jgi:hypothetical protein